MGTPSVTAEDSPDQSISDALEVFAIRFCYIPNARKLEGSPSVSHFCPTVFAIRS